MWSSNERSLSIVTPSTRILLINGTLAPVTMMPADWSILTTCWRFPVTSASVFVGFSSWSFRICQVVTASAHAERFRKLFGALVIAVYSWISSAYWWYRISNDLINESTGFVKIVNSNGPRTEPHRNCWRTTTSYRYKLRSTSKLRVQPLCRRNPIVPWSGGGVVDGRECRKRRWCQAIATPMTLWWSVVDNRSLTTLVIAVINVWNGSLWIATCYNTAARGATVWNRSAQLFLPLATQFAIHVDYT